ncbi:hypothetical protein TrRE_jg331 [Triparma retinervis]|uniref:CAAX prenyl protease n=1 Tax=Triparma retinervis TaxID=2557542 RepID=A0A9W7KSC1_9STRA|nr:hypothetical protein TrRE_jg331 [Triparma retinervis]
MVVGFEYWLDCRQAKQFKDKEEPKELFDIVAKVEKDVKDKDKPAKDKPAKDSDKKDEKKESLSSRMRSQFKSSSAYGLDKLTFSQLTKFVSILETFAYLLLGLFPYFWTLACTAGAKFGWTEGEDEIKISCLFFIISTVAGEIIQLPFSLYSQFVIEERHGFNKNTLGLFLTDKLKSQVLTYAIGSPFLALLLKIVHTFGDMFYVYVWGLVLFFSIFMLTVYPEFIMPMFNKFTPLEDGPLKTKIEDLASTINYPLTKLFVIDGSKRSSHSNAFMFGFGKNKRIVLFDTLMDQVNETELLSILGHELGHWALSHTAINFLVTQLYFGAAFYTFGIFQNYPQLYAAFGFPEDGVPSIVALFLFFQTVWAPVDKVISFLLTLNSRACEYQADKYSIAKLRQTGLKSGLTKIHLENLGAMKIDWLYSMYHHSHPTLGERLKRMGEEEAKLVKRD